MDKALELADILENRCEEHQLNASYMLRQQKVEIDRLTMLCDCMTTESNRKGNEIEELKQIIDANNLSQNIGRFVKAANEPVAWIDPKELDMDVSTSVTKNKQFESDIPLYVQPQKYCPSENNEAYEKGFIDGMAKQRDSAVQRFVESGTPDSELAEHKRIIREQQAEIEALRNRNWDLVSEPWGFDRHSIKELKYMGDDDYYIELCDKQQAEIEALKLQIHTTLTNRNLRTYDGKAQE